MAMKSIKSKLTQIQLFIAFVVLFASSVTYLFNDFLIFRRPFERSLETTSKILAQNLEPVLAFSDPVEATKILNSLQSEPAIVAASVYDSKGDVFAKFGEKNNFEPYRAIPEAPQYSQLKGRHL